VDAPTQSSSRLGGALGAGLLVAVLFALVLGVYGAVYIDAFRPSPVPEAGAPPVAAAVGQLPAAPPGPRASGTAAPPPALVQPAPAPSIAESAQATAAVPPPPPTGQSDTITPTAGPAVPRESAKPLYWVEYGAYRGPFYAEKLASRLHAVGIDAEIQRVVGAGGHRYFTVRSAANDRAAVTVAAKEAHRLGVVPLIRRGHRPVAAEPAVAKAEAKAVGRTARVWWVQFGAYNVRAYALALRDRLRQAGIVATVSERHRPGYARYLVRSAAPLRHGEARRLAAHGESLLGIAPLVGRAPHPKPRP